MTTQEILTDEMPNDWLPWATWALFFYDKQKDFVRSQKKEVWFIGGNGTGKSVILYWLFVGHMLGIAPSRLAKPPITIRVLVPSFDNVEKIALEKMCQPQRIVFKPPLNDKQKAWTEFLDSQGMLTDLSENSLEIAQMLPKSMIIPTKDFKKEHRGIELINGSAIWWVTTEQGWMSMRGPEQDIEGVDEEPGWDEFNQVKRGLRNAKGGGRIYGSLTPPYKEGQGPTWTKEKVLDASMKDDNIHVINACMADNPAITPTYIEWWSQGKSQKRLDVELYGKYPAWGDMVHPDFQDREWNSQKVDGHLLPNESPMPRNNEVDWVMAFDWHSSKPCAGVWGWIDRAGNPVIFDELDRDLAEDKTIDELAQLFLNIEGYPYSQRKFRRWQDPSAKSAYKAVQRGFNAWNAFRKVGIVTSAGHNRDPDIGIGIVNQYFKGNGRDSPRIFIYERCKYLRQYLDNHYWKRGEDGKAKPDPKWSDYPICLRYILQEVGIRKPKNQRRNWPLQSFQKPKSDKITIDLGRWI